MELLDLMRKALEKGASDVHLVAGMKPSMRLNGEILDMEEPVLSAEECKKLTYSVMKEDQMQRFEKKRELDFSLTYPDVRARANVFFDKGSVGSSFRLIPLKIKSLDELGIPPIAAELTMKPAGLVLIAGATGMGKTTTATALVDYVNRTRRSRIITIEDPIEYVHSPKLSTVIQREVCPDITCDTMDFHSALTSALREDPNIIFLGEIRDLSTFAIALSAAETGHLILGTINTHDTLHTINRIIDLFPPNQQVQVRSQLSNCLEAIISQRLVPRTRGSGRVLATEVFICTRAARTLIQDNRLEQLDSLIQMGRNAGMYTIGPFFTSALDKRRHFH